MTVPAVPHIDTLVLCSTIPGCGVGHTAVSFEARDQPRGDHEAISFPLLVDDEFSDDDPPKVLVLGPDTAGNVLEVIGSFNAPGLLTVFHAMPARAGYVQRLERKET